MKNPFNRPMFRKKAMANFGPQGILASSPELMTAVQRARARQQPVRAQAGLSVNMDVADLSPRGLNSRDLIGFVRSQMNPSDPNFNSIANMPRAQLVDLAEGYLSRASGATDRGAQPTSVGKAIPDASRGVQIPGMAVRGVSGPSNQNAGILDTEAGRNVSSIVETGLSPSEAAVSPRPDSALRSNLSPTGAAGEAESVPSVSETLAGDLPLSRQPSGKSKFLSDVAVAKSGFADSEIKEDEQAANAAKNDASAGISQTGTDGKPKPFSELVQDRFDFLKSFVGEEEAEEVKDDLRTSFGYNMIMGALRMAADDDVDRGAAFARAFGTQLGEFGAVRGEERKAERKRKDTARAEDRALKLAAVSQVLDDESKTKKPAALTTLKKDDQTTTLRADDPKVDELIAAGYNKVSGGTNVSVNTGATTTKFSEELQKADAKNIEEARKNANLFEDQLGAVDTITNIYDRIESEGFDLDDTTGAGAEALFQFKESIARYAGLFGIDPKDVGIDMDKLADQQALRSAFNNLTLEMTKKLKGAISEKELDLSSRATANFGNSPLANRMILLTMKGTAAKAQMVAEETERFYAQKYPGDGSIQRTVTIDGKDYTSFEQFKRDVINRDDEFVVKRMIPEIKSRGEMDALIKNAGGMDKLSDDVLVMMDERLGQIQ